MKWDTTESNLSRVEKLANKYNVTIPKSSEMMFWPIFILEAMDKRIEDLEKKNL